MMASPGFLSQLMTDTFQIIFSLKDKNGIVELDQGWIL
jgi:hypothetical protein